MIRVLDRPRNGVAASGAHERPDAVLLATVRRGLRGFQSDVFLDIERDVVSVIRSASDTRAPRSRALDALSRTVDGFCKRYGCTVIGGVSPVDRGVFGVPALYRRAVEVMRAGVFAGHTGILSSEACRCPADGRQRPGLLVDQAWLLRLTEAIQDGSLVQTGRLLDELGRTVRTQPISHNSTVRDTLCRVTSTIEQAACAYDAERRCLLQLNGVYETLSQIATKSAAIELVYDLALCAASMAETKRQQKGENFLVAQVLEYIRENVETPFSLGTAAGYVGVTPCHLSRTFRVVTGETFSDHVRRIKIRRATILLKTTNLRIYEVAYRLHYRSVQYFSTAFRDTLGLTPSQYRNA